MALSRDSLMRSLTKLRRAYRFAVNCKSRRSRRRRARLSHISARARTTYADAESYVGPCSSLATMQNSPFNVALRRVNDVALAESSHSRFNFLSLWCRRHRQLRRNVSDSRNGGVYGAAYVISNPSNFSVDFDFARDTIYVFANIFLIFPPQSKLYVQRVSSSKTRQFPEE